MIDLFLLLIISISNLQKSFGKYRNKYYCNIHKHICREVNSKGHKHKNQSHVHNCFWTIVRGKTQCEKTGAADEGFIKFFSKWIFTRNILANRIWRHLRQNSRLLLTNPWYPDQPLFVSVPICVFLCTVLALDYVSLRRDCVGSLCCSLKLPPVAHYCPLSLISVTTDSLLSVTTHIRSLISG